MVFVEPHRNLAENVVLHDRIGIVGTRAPGRVVRVARRNRVVVEIDSARERCSVPSVEVESRNVECPPVIVYDVENDGESLLMAGIDEGFEIVGAAILIVVDGILIGWAIGIAADRGELCHRSQLDCIEAHTGDLTQLADLRLERAPARRSGVELTGVHLIDHELVERWRREILVVPEVGRGIVSNGMAVARIRDQTSVGIAAGYRAETRRRDHVVVPLIDTHHPERRGTNILWCPAGSMRRSARTKDLLCSPQTRAAPIRETRRLDKGRPGDRGLSRPRCPRVDTAPKPRQTAGISVVKEEEIWA